MHTKATKDFSKRFWGKVQMGNKQECWEWQGAIQSKGYGSVSIGNKKTGLAHRVAYRLTKGEIPQGLCVLHKCDNRRCVNPNHLRLGTLQDNSADMVAKGRQAKGERSGRAKLSLDNIHEMRSLYSTGEYSYADLGRRYKITPSYTRQVVRGDYWKLPLAE